MKGTRARCAMQSFGIWTRPCLAVPWRRVQPIPGITSQRRNAHEHQGSEQQPSALPRTQPGRSGHRYFRRAGPCAGGDQCGAVHHSAVHDRLVLRVRDARNQRGEHQLLPRAPLAGHGAHRAARHARGQGVQPGVQRFHPGDAASADGGQHLHGHRRHAIVYQSGPAEAGSRLVLLRPRTDDDSACDQSAGHDALSRHQGQSGRAEQEHARPVLRHRADRERRDGDPAAGQAQGLLPDRAVQGLEPEQGRDRSADVRLHRPHVRVLCAVSADRVHRWPDAVAEALRSELRPAGHVQLHGQGPPAARVPAHRDRPEPAGPGRSGEGLQQGHHVHVGHHRSGRGQPDCPGPFAVALSAWPGATGPAAADGCQRKIPRGPAVPGDRLPLVHRDRPARAVGRRRGQVPLRGRDAP